MFFKFSSDLVWSQKKSLFLVYFVYMCLDPFNKLLIDGSKGNGDKSTYLAYKN